MQNTQNLPQIHIGNRLTGTIKGLRLNRYANNNALAVSAEVVWDDGEFDPPQPVSVNLSSDTNNYASDILPPDEFYAKSYSEGERLVTTLYNYGWIEISGLPAKTGFVSCWRCRVTPNAVILSDKSK
jgi:hypothetical protein